MQCCLASSAILIHSFTLYKRRLSEQARSVGDRVSSRRQILEKFGIEFRKTEPRGFLWVSKMNIIKWADKTLGSYLVEDKKNLLRSRFLP